MIEEVYVIKGTTFSEKGSVPLGGGIGRIFRMFGELPKNVRLQAFLGNSGARITYVI